MQAQAEGLVRCSGSSDDWMEFSFKAEPGRAPGQDTTGLRVRETVGSGGAWKLANAVSLKISKGGLSVQERRKRSPQTVRHQGA